MNPSQRTQTTAAILAILVLKQVISGHRVVTSGKPRNATGKDASVIKPLRSQPDKVMPRPSILQLVGSIDDYKCPEGLVIVKDSIDPSFYDKNQRKIPKIIHMTSRTRCMTQAFAANVHSWRFEGHSVFLHDDDAVARLLNRWWPEFPSIHDVKNA